MAVAPPATAMSPSRRGDSGGSRSAEQRERDRRERERKRQRRDGGRAAGAEPYDILSAGADPTLSRPPDLDWPGDGLSDHSAGRDDARGPAFDAEGRHLIFDPETGSQVFVPAEPVQEDPPPPPVTHEPQEYYDPEPWYPPETDYQPHALPDGDERAAGVGGARRRLAGRLPSVSLPAGRPTLSGSLSGIGDRLSGLRRPKAEGADDGADRNGGPSGRSVRRFPSASGGVVSRAGSLRRSLDPRTARRSAVTSSRNRISAGPRGRRGRIAAIAAIVFVLFALWFLISLFQPLKGSGSGQVNVVIPPGSGTSAIASLLAKDHVISSAFFFKLRVELSGKRGKLESGRYVLRQGMSYGAALSALSGNSPGAGDCEGDDPGGLLAGRDRGARHEGGARR